MAQSLTFSIAGCVCISVVGHPCWGHKFQLRSSEGKLRHRRRVRVLLPAEESQASSEGSSSCSARTGKQGQGHGEDAGQDAAKDARGEGTKRKGQHQAPAGRAGAEISTATAEKEKSEAGSTTPKAVAWLARRGNIFSTILCSLLTVRCVSC